MNAFVLVVRSQHVHLLYYMCVRQCLLSLTLLFAPPLQAVSLMPYPVLLVKSLDTDTTRLVKEFAAEKEERTRHSVLHVMSTLRMLYGSSVSKPSKLVCMHVRYNSSITVNDSYTYERDIDNAPPCAASFPLYNEKRNAALLRPLHYHCNQPVQSLLMLRQTLVNQMMQLITRNRVFKGVSQFVCIE